MVFLSTPRLLLIHILYIFKINNSNNGYVPNIPYRLKSVSIEELIVNHREIDLKSAIFQD